jgi:hypothetical protein
VARIIYMGGHTLSYLTYILILFHTPVFQEWLEIGGVDTLSENLTYILIMFPTPVFQEWLEVGGVDTLSQNLTYVKTLVELLSTGSRQMGVQVKKKICFCWGMSGNCG